MDPERSEDRVPAADGKGEWFAGAPLSRPRKETHKGKKKENNLEKVHFPAMSLPGKTKTSEGGTVRAYHP